ncbi:MAG TPA: hypothetical protein VKU00_02440, partial [Chthonomonadaceae bacterium]|nr:hypothetical protein [Chthonomonadaceae bacterium]
MMNCTRCQNAFDPTRSAVCPFCGAPVSAPQATAAPRRRVSLTGEEVIDEAPPAPPPPQPLPGQALPPRQPLPPQGGPPRAQAPVRPPVDTAPAMLDGERRFFRILWTVLGVLGVAALIGSFFLFNRYAEGQRKYEQESHLHLSTPKAAASEVIYSMRQDAMSRLFLVTQFSDDRQKDLLEAKAFTIGTHISEHLVPGSSDTLGSVFHSMTKIQYGEPQGK